MFHFTILCWVWWIIKQPRQLHTDEDNYKKFVFMTSGESGNAPYKGGLGEMVKIMPFFISHIGEMVIHKKKLWWHRKFCLLFTTTIIIMFYSQCYFTTTIIIYVFLHNAILHFILNALNSNVHKITIYRKWWRRKDKGHLVWSWQEDFLLSILGSISSV